MKSALDKVFNIKFDNLFLHEDYVLSVEKENTITENGWMRVFDISPISGSGPKFIARCDFDDAKGKEEMDIDIHNVNESTRDLFRKGKEGYIGHKTKNIKPEHRTFYVHIEINGTLYFEGNIFFNVNRSI